MAVKIPLLYIPPKCTRSTMNRKQFSASSRSSESLAAPNSLANVTSLLYIMPVRVNTVLNNNVKAFHSAHISCPECWWLPMSRPALKLFRTSRGYMTTQRPTQTVAERLAGTAESFHGNITEDGPFKPERDRYHMYIGLFCPFAHRANLVRHLKGLQDIVPMSVVRPYPKGDEMGWPGWKFPKDDNEYPAATSDRLFGSEYLHEIYFKADSEYKGRYSVPCVWDKKNETIMNNESAELLRDWRKSSVQALRPTQCIQVK